MSSRAIILYRKIEALAEPDRTRFVEEWAATKARETEYLEFKRVSDDNTVKKAWSEALSGFANTEGGILVWGIGTEKLKLPDADRKIDVATETKPVPNTAAFGQFLRDNLMDSTIEPVRGVEYLEIPATAGGGYVLCLIPEGNGKPYRDDRAKQYWQRIGDSFVVIPHTLLRSLFYPQSRPWFDACIYWAGTHYIQIDLFNKGKVSADGVYVRIRYKNDQWELRSPKPFQEVSRMGDDNWRSYAAECTTSIHPLQQLCCASIRLTGPSERMAVAPIEMVLHCRDSEPIKYRIDSDHPFAHLEKPRLLKAVE